MCDSMRRKTEDKNNRAQHKKGIRNMSTETINTSVQIPVPRSAADCPGEWWWVHATAGKERSTRKGVGEHHSPKWIQFDNLSA